MKVIFVPLVFIMFVFNCFATSVESKISIDAEQVSQECLSNKWQKAELIQLKENKFKLENEAERRTLALQLLNCLASTDSEIRDGIAFEALSYWLRGAQLSQEVHNQMFDYLTNVITLQVNDPNGVYQTFSVLVLAEIARVDRKKPFLTKMRRNYLVTIGTEYLSTLRDYRGFSNNIGWRHGVAHSSDLMLQLALNPAISKDQLTLILDALASQVTANQQHSYIHGEPKRIAMAVLYVFLRKEHSNEEWSIWLSKVINSAPFEHWQAVFKSETGLAKLHNTQSFLNTLYAIIKPSKNETLIKMVPALEKAIKEVN